MSIDISRLAIEVTTSGIKEASDALGSKGLAKSAENADTKIQSLTTNLGKLMTASSGVQGNISGLTGTMNTIHAAIASVSQSAAAMATSLNQAVNGLNGLNTAGQNTNNTLRSMNQHGGVVTTTLKAMATAALAYFSVSSVKNIVEQADAWGIMQAKLKLATGSMEVAKKTQQDMFIMAQNLRAPMDDMGKLFTRLTPALTRMGKPMSDVRDMVEGMTLALKLGGATGAEAASTMLQFSQAANAGRLNGAEFNAVAENGVVILRALEDHLGKSQAELKKMGSEGKLTFDIISDAMAAKLPQWRKDFQELPLTFEGAMQRLKNAWFKAIGEMGQETELGKKMAESLLKLEQSIPAIAETVVTALNFIIDHGKALTAVFGGLIAMGMVKWAMDAAASFAVVTTAITAAGGAAAVLRTALAFLGGPIGILIGLLSAAGIAWAAFADDGKTASTALTVKTTQDVDSRIKELNREIEKLNERNAAGKKKEEGGPIKNPLSDTAQESLQTLIKLRTEYEKVPGSAKAGLKVAIDLKQAEFERLMSAEQAYKAVKAHTDAMATQVKYEALILDYKKKLASGEMKANFEVEEAREAFKVLGKDLPASIEALIRAKYADKKAQREVSQAIKDANTAYENQLQLYKELAATTTGLDKHGKDFDKLTVSQKAVIQLERELQKATNDTAISRLQEALAIARANVEMEAGIKQRRDAIKAEEDFTKSQDDAFTAAQRELVTLNNKIAGYGQVKGAVEEAALAQARYVMMTQGDTMTDEQVAKQQALIDKLKEVAAMKSELGQLELGTSIDKAFEKMKPADFGKDFADAFGAVGKSIDKAGKALDSFSKKMRQNGTLRDEIMSVKDDKKRAAGLERLRKEELKDTVDMYADMAGAVKGFFKEKTGAYKFFDAFEKGMRVAQMALTMQDFVQRMFFEDAILAKETATTGASIALDTAETGVKTGNSMVKAGASTVAGVAKAFEQMGVWGFVGAAAIIAFMAAMGVGGGGGGGGGLRNPAGEIESLEDRQARQGTGTVLGDDSAKSESIKNALEALRENSNVGLVYSSEMLVSLRNIDMKMGGLTASIAGVKGMTKGTNFGIQTGTQSGRGLFGSGVFGSKTTTDILDTGILLNGRMSDFMNGGGVSQYADVQTTKKKWYGKTSTSTSRQTQGVDSQLTEYISSIFGDINDAIVTASVSLGKNGDAVKAALAKYVINTEISLKDLKGEDLEAALNAIFSSAADGMAKSVLSEFKGFQRAGEGMFETITRVAAGSERAQDALEKLGINMIALNDIAVKTGEVDVELVRSSIMREEAGTTLAEIFRLMDGSMEDMVGAYKELTRLRNSMESVGLGSDITLDLIRGAGGISGLSDAFSEYFDGMFTEQERAQMATSRMTMEFGRLGIAVPRTKQEFRSLVQALMAGGAAGEEMAGRVLALAGDWTEAMESVESATEEALSAARDSLSEAYDNEAEALENVRDKMRDFASSLKEFRMGLMTGDMSNLSPTEKYATIAAQYEAISQAALAGDEDAIGKFEGVAQEFLEMSREYNASGAQYNADFARVLAETEAIEAIAGGKATVAEQQLDALNQQVAGLLAVEESVKTVAQAITDLHAAMAAAGAIAGPTAAPVAATTAQTTADSNAALVAEIVALRAEVTTLRQEQAAQTAAQINATVISNQQNAETINDGLEESASHYGYRGNLERRALV